MELFKLLGTIAIDTADMEQAFKKARADGKQTEQNLKGTFSKMGGAAVAFGKTVATGVAAGATAVGGLVAKSVSAYADYEQLVGGVETLFKGSADTVIKYASDAYKTAGLSANEYMETVTSFSASLLQSLGGDTVEAAKYADLAITDMSDNANKMGSDMTSIQNAYQGFAKQNYTMLDNLKLGYGGTKEEMQRLIDDANKLKKANGETADLTIESYADVVEAIHTVQTEMGITGTTAKEAEGTISGSIAMTKSAWENLMSGLAQGNADIPALVSNVVSSGSKVLENIIPVAKEVLKNIPVAISEISPEAGAAFQTIIDICIGAFDVLTSAIKPTFELVTNIFNYLKENTWVLTTLAVTIGVITTAIGLYNAVSAIKAAMAAAEVTTVWGLVSAYAAQAVAMMAAIAPYLLIAAAIAAVIAIGVALYKNWDTIKEKAIELAGRLKEKFEEIRAAIAEKFNQAKEKAVQIFENLKQAVSNVWQGIKNAVKVGVMFIVELVKAAFQLITLPWRFIWENCKEYIIAAWNFIKNAVSKALQSIKNTISKIWNSIVKVLSPILSKIQNAVSKAWNFVKDKTSSIFESVKSKISNIWNSCKNLISNVISSIKSTISNGFQTAKNVVSNVLTSMKSSISEKLNSAKSVVSNVLGGIKDKFSSIFESAKNIVKNAINKIKSYFNFSWSLPRLKLPHFSISGKFSLNPPSVPHFSVDWYKKAMDNAMILNSPTIFGYSAASGKFLGGGEAGSEVVAGSNTLMNMIQGAVATQNEVLVYYLQKMIDIVATYFPQVLEAMDRDLVWDDGVVAARLAPKMNYELGKLSTRKDRGR